MKSKIKRHEQPLTLHGLLGAVSYWGTGARIFLLTVIASLVFALNLMFNQSTDFVSSEIMMLVYTLGTLFVLDFCYVILARARPLNRRIDQLSLISTEFMLVLLYITPTVFIMPSNFEVLRYGALLLAFFVLACRYLIGELGDASRGKKR